MGPDAQKKVLRIKRLVNGEWKTEIIRDPAVIAAYVKRRQVIEEEALTADVLAPTGDADKDRRAKKRFAQHFGRICDCSLIVCLSISGWRKRLRE